jgi:hypothetical protein
MLKKIAQCIKRYVNRLAYKLTQLIGHVVNRLPVSSVADVSDSMSRMSPSSATAGVEISDSDSTDLKCAKIYTISSAIFGSLLLSRSLDDASSWNFYGCADFALIRPLFV